jgi:hypothetical protein
MSLLDPEYAASSFLMDVVPYISATWIDNHNNPPLCTEQIGANFIALFIRRDSPAFEYAPSPNRKNMRILGLGLRTSSIQFGSVHPAAQRNITYRRVGVVYRRLWVRMTVRRLERWVGQL